MIITQIRSQCSQQLNSSWYVMCFCHLWVFSCVFCYFSCVFAHFQFHAFLRVFVKEHRPRTQPLTVASDPVMCKRQNEVCFQPCYNPWWLIGLRTPTSLPSTEHGILTESISLFCRKSFAFKHLSC